MTEILLVGDKNKIAVQVDLIDDNSNEGKLFMYIAGTKFGSYYDDYDVKRSVRNILDCYHIPSIDVQDLFNCPISILFEAYSEANDSQLWLEKFDEEYFAHNQISSAIDRYYSNFMRDFALEEVGHLDYLCFRLGEYTFDFDEIYIIPNSNGLLRVCAKNRDGELAEGVIDKDEFINIWQTVYNNMA